MVLDIVDSALVKRGPSSCLALIRKYNSRAMATCLVSTGATNKGLTTADSLKSRTKNTGVCWQQRLFGKQLLECKRAGTTSKDSTSASKILDVSVALGANHNVANTKNRNKPKCEVIGVYFSFINTGATCDDFTRQLTELYANVNETMNNREKINGDYQKASIDDDNESSAEIGNRESEDGGDRKKKFEVVHVVLWSNVADVLDFDESFRNHVADLPWLAVPNHDYERKVPDSRVVHPGFSRPKDTVRKGVAYRRRMSLRAHMAPDGSEMQRNAQMYWPFAMTRLTRRYRIKAGVPTLILLEGDTGSVVTRGGVERAMDDPTGSNFPWRPPHPKATLEDGPLLPCGARDSNEPMLHEELRNCVKGVYFSAHWCPPCKAFTPQLVDTYQRIRERGHNFEVIFVSSDRSEESYNAYIESMPWLRIPFAQEERRQKLARALDVQAIPNLVILDTRDNIITLEGRAELLEDPEGLNFPWTTRLVNILTEKYATSLHDAPAIILFVEGDDCEVHFGESVLLPAAESYRCDRPDYDPNYDDPDGTLQFYIALDCETSDILREFVGLDDAVPLLTAIDIPRGIYAVMEDGAEITVDSVQHFVDGFRNDKMATCKISSVRRTSKNETISTS